MEGLADTLDALANLSVKVDDQVGQGSITIVTAAGALLGMELGPIGMFGGGVAGFVGGAADASSFVDRYSHTEEYEKVRKLHGQKQKELRNKCENLRTPETP